jgi:hypothetical protein
MRSPYDPASEPVSYANDSFCDLASGGGYQAGCRGQAGQRNRRPSEYDRFPGLPTQYDAEQQLDLQAATYDSQGRRATFDRVIEAQLLAQYRMLEC